MNKSCTFFNKTIKNLDGFECGLKKFIANLYYYDFGYYTMAPLFLIVIISIFGQFKGHYRWFILNQVIWDLIISNEYSCQNRIKDGVKTGPKCFYYMSTYISENEWDISRYVTDFVYRIIINSPFSGSVLLSLTRFLALYFPNLYDRLTEGRKIVLTILIYNVATLIFDIGAVFDFLRAKRGVDALNLVCRDSTENDLKCKNDSLFKFYETLYYGFSMAQFLKPCLFLVISIIATAAIIWKIAKQAKFQLKHNRKDFASSVRIGIVIGLQTLINGFVFFIDIYNRFIPNLNAVYRVKIVSGLIYDNILDNLGYYKKYEFLDVRLPTWLDSTNGLMSVGSRQMIVQFRILLEAIIILGIMTGYRESLINFVKSMFMFVRNPKKPFKRLYSNVTKISSTTVKKF